MKFFSTSGRIRVAQQGQATVDLDIIPSQVNISEFQGFEDDRFINHREVGVYAGAGLTGGGDLAGSRELAIDIGWLAKWFGLHPPSHDMLHGVSPSQHVDHSRVGVEAGIGLTGGGDLTQGRTLSLSIEELPVVKTVSPSDWIILENDDGICRVRVGDMFASMRREFGL